MDGKLFTWKYKKKTIVIFAKDLTQARIVALKELCKSLDDNTLGLSRILNSKPIIYKHPVLMIKEN